MTSISTNVDKSPVRKMIQTGGNCRIRRIDNITFKTPLHLSGDSECDGGYIDHVKAGHFRAMKDAIAIYQQIWPHLGLLSGFEAVEDGFSMEFLPRGCLEKFITNQDSQRLNEVQMHNWFLQLATTFFPTFTSQNSSLSTSRDATSWSQMIALSNSSISVNPTFLKRTTRNPWSFTITALSRSTYFTSETSCT
ncbi:hypothetical protein K470DRAFT_72381 [Piedraia hortae CBS 480.64]|uniref:Uncharacterized protein n=1 Tax=Piedraia hortae CBS 480.64 TaxID=1314780 RepID=A0A6A7BYW3_9PEZI|nr:hypothetical protein K470DRAFT_72381 [Piedraia hortae CBS 480.64]